MQLSLLLETAEESVVLTVAFLAFSADFFVGVSVGVEPEPLHDLLV